MITKEERNAVLEEAAALIDQDKAFWAIMAASTYERLMACGKEDCDRRVNLTQQHMHECAMRITAKAHANKIRSAKQS